jgi:hypothetical protein
MPPRAAVFECPCCLGSTSLPLQPGERAPLRRACPNGGCWSCLGACRAQTRRVEVVRLPPPAGLQFLAPSRPGAPA